MKLSDRIKLCRKNLGLAQEDVAKRANISQPSYQKIEKGKVENPKRLNKLSEVFQTTPEWLKYGTGNPPPYLQMPSIPVGKIPLLTWDLIKSWHSSYDIEALLEAGSFRVSESTAGDSLQQVEFIDILHRSNSKQFALKVRGDSMVSPLPGKRSFLESDIIIIDPEIPPERDSFVIALQHGSSQALFKQLVIDGDSKYLRPLNPQYPMIPLDDSIDICGVVVAHYDVLV